MSFNAHGFNAALDSWMAAAGRQSGVGAEDAAKAVKTATRRILTANWHDEGTKSPSPLGGPPASISGRLAGSLLVSRDGADSAKVGPTDSARSWNGPYARFLELGGTHAAHRGWMRWREDGRSHRAKVLRKTSRPYLMPGLHAAIDSGAVNAAFYTAWLRAQMEAV